MAGQHVFALFVITKFFYVITNKCNKKRRA